VTYQNISMRITLRYLGVPVKGATHTCGDNESVVNSSSACSPCKTAQATCHAVLSPCPRSNCLQVDDFQLHPRRQ
jgi:hypothetical protein